MSICSFHLVLTVQIFRNKFSTLVAKLVLHSVPDIEIRMCSLQVESEI